MSDTTKGPLVIYHGGCRDGFCAAWVIHRYLQRRGEDGEFFAGYYGKNPPDCRGRVVIIVDFSYPLEMMKKIADEAVSLVVLDHHKTAQEALSEFAKNSPENTRVIFDMNYSGAGLAYLYYFGTEDETGPRPWLVAYVEDRDLWRFSLDDTKVINAYIGTIPFDFSAWDEAELLDLTQAFLHGRGAAAKVAQYVAEVRKNAIWITFEGHLVPIVNAPQVDISELVGALAEGHPYSGAPGPGAAPWPDGVIVPGFAVGWFQTSDGRFAYSLRSCGDFDVSAIAKKYGGGGHKNAAGFQADTLLHVRGG